MRNLIKLCALIFIGALLSCSQTSKDVRVVENFGQHWTFNLGDVENASSSDFDDSDWRTLNVPHDWAIEGEFSKDNPSGANGGALPGGIGWYRKSFTFDAADSTKLVFIDFDGVYMNSDVYINGHHLGHRPYGYISFRYDLTPFLNFGENENVLAVRVDNSLQPNSRWYSGCGIYRNVWLTKVNPVYVDLWGTYVTTPEITNESATVRVKTIVKNDDQENKTVILKSIIVDAHNKIVAQQESSHEIAALGPFEFSADILVKNPVLWSVESPTLYSLKSEVVIDGILVDDYTTTFGIRSFEFDMDKGFILNGEQLKIKGVCMHHDLGCLGSAVNTRALERQLEILKEMGCNGIRTSHNPPTPELLDLCDKMGFIVQDEAFDMWKLQKTTYDYSLYYDEWHERDLVDFILRDRNHPSIFMWSIGNEILEQWDESGTEMTRELAGIVRKYDNTRPITSGCNDFSAENKIISSGAVDIVGMNYQQDKWANFKEVFPGQKFIATETGSAIATRGSYDMPSDSIRVWPKDWRVLQKYNDDYTCSSYDNCRVGWGSTHRFTWDMIKKNDYMSGMYYWTGFDYLGEPTPYGWPARSSYFGIIDLAGFPKDAYYFYQAEWTDKDVLHLFPHWNWTKGDSVDVWAYSNFDTVELFVNGESMGVQKNADDKYHFVWKTVFKPGEIKAVGKNSVGSTKTKIIKTAGEPAGFLVSVDRDRIKADGKDLAFVSVTVVDENGTIVPKADNLVNFDISGSGFIAGVDNGHQISHEPFKANYRKAFNGKCLAVIQNNGDKGTVELIVSADGLKSQTVKIVAK